MKPSNCRNLKSAKQTQRKTKLKTRMSTTTPSGQYPPHITPPPLPQALRYIRVHTQTHKRRSKRQCVKGNVVGKFKGAATIAEPRVCGQIKKWANLVDPQRQDPPALTGPAGEKQGFVSANQCRLQIPQRPLYFTFSRAGLRPEVKNYSTDEL